MNPATRPVKVTVNGKTYVVEVGDLAASPLSVTVNGQPYVVTVEAIPPEWGGPPAPATPITRPAAPTARPVPNLAAQITAPLPGYIVNVAVKPGEAVGLGQTLCALEAMKMKSAIRSPRAGVIAAVNVTEGQSVSYGETLFKFE